MKGAVILLLAVLCSVFSSQAASTLRGDRISEKGTGGLRREDYIVWCSGDICCPMHLSCCHNGLCCDQHWRVTQAFRCEG